ncbi:hypothetical protein RHMOL_Rhmol12G0067100 [Rhododendron molle]|uniref:Uncharacterized protein n=1 Tax=Rhododendron molle TaxID=49168 RepID=A0ACC0LFF8_RHOML|nr:hypothetical protein RHMOL_Rhmol12G0067100 [Rhododendron molle]
MNYLECDDDNGDDSPAVNKRIKSESKEYGYKVGVVGEELAGVKGKEDVVKDQLKGKGTQNWRKRTSKIENSSSDFRCFSRVLWYWKKEMTENSVVNGILNYTRSKRVGWDNGTVICDEKLKKLFNVDCFHICYIPDYVKPHFLKRALDD